MKVIPSGDYILKWHRSDFYLNANAVYHFFPQCRGTREGLDLIMNFWTQLLWRERLVGVAHESVVCVFKTVFKYSFCIVILKTPVRIPNHCGFDLAGIWKVADSERKPPLNREHVWLARGPRVWALVYLSHGPSLRSWRGQGMLDFILLGSPHQLRKTPPISSAGAPATCAPERQVVLGPPGDEMRYVLFTPLYLWSVRLLMVQIKGFWFFFLFIFGPGKLESFERWGGGSDLEGAAAVPPLLSHPIPAPLKWHHRSTNPLRPQDEMQFLPSQPSPRPASTRLAEVVMFFLCRFIGAVGKAPWECK